MNSPIALPRNSEARPSTTQQQWLLYARLLLGVGWIVEATIGRFWKWGWFGSGVNPDWLGETAGATIISTAERAQEDGVWGWYSSVLDGVVLGNAEFLSWATSITQVLFGVLLVFGLFSRLAALSGLGMLVSILLMGSFRTSPLLIALTLFVLLAGAERFGSLDGRLRDTALRPVVTLGLDQTVKRFAPWIAAAAGPIAIYFLLQQATRPTPRFIYVGQEFAVFSIAVVAAVIMIGVNGMNRLEVATGLLRMYVGYKLLWWIWTAPQAALTSLPGFNDGTELEEVLLAGAETHLPVLSSIVESVFAPGAGLWAIVLGLVQAVLGFLLISGWRAKSATAATVALLTLYILLGFTRYAPYLASMALLAYALGSAPQVSLIDLVTGRRTKPGSALRFSRSAMYALVIASVVLAVGAVVSGITPNGYNNDVGSTVLWTLALNLSMVAAAAVYAVMDTQTIDIRSDQKSPKDEQLEENLAAAT